VFWHNLFLTGNSKGCNQAQSRSRIDMTTELPEQAQILDPPPQFSLRMMFIIQAVCAVYFAILVTCKVFAVPIA
jgi:hypothetical protein